MNNWMNSSIKTSTFAIAKPSGAWPCCCARAPTRTRRSRTGPRPSSWRRRMGRGTASIRCCRRAPISTRRVGAVIGSEESDFGDHLQKILNMSIMSWEGSDFGCKFFWDLSELLPGDQSRSAAALRGRTGAMLKRVDKINKNNRQIPLKPYQIYQKSVQVHMKPIETP